MVEKGRKIGENLKNVQKVAKHFRDLTFLYLVLS